MEAVGEETAGIPWPPVKTHEDSHPRSALLPRSHLALLGLQQGPCFKHGPRNSALPNLIHLTCGKHLCSGFLACL